jgi:hypothetical protein
MYSLKYADILKVSFTPRHEDVTSTKEIKAATVVSKVTCNNVIQYCNNI